MENVQLCYGVHFHSCVGVVGYFLFDMCCLFDVCYHVALVGICFSVVNTVFCNTMLLIALFCSLRIVILKSVAKIQCVIVISISDTLCTH